MLPQKSLKIPDVGIPIDPSRQDVVFEMSQNRKLSSTFTNTEFPPLAAAADFRMADQPPAIPLVEPFSYNFPRSGIVFSYAPRTQICSTSSTADRLVEHPTHFSNVSFIGGKE